MPGVKLIPLNSAASMIFAGRRFAWLASRRMWFGIFLCLFLDTLLHAQWQAARFEHITPEDGLIQSGVQTIYQDSQGFMWFGTETGLNRYDGIRFQTYVHDELDEQTLSSNDVRVLYQDHSETLWVGTTRGLNRYNSGKDFFIPHSSPTIPQLSEAKIYSLLEPRDGELWIGTYGQGLILLNVSRNEGNVFMPDEKDSRAISNKGIITMLEDKRGDVWIGTYDGLNRYENGRFVKYFHDPNRPESSLADSIIMGLAEDSSGKIWVAGWAGLSTYDRGKDRFFPVTTPNMPVETKHAFFGGGSLWFGTNIGLARYDALNDRFDWYRNSITDPHSLSNDVVSCVFVDQTGVVWVGTSGGGINKMSTRQKNFKHYQSLQETENSLGNNNVHPIVVARDKIWVGTDRGLNMIDRGNDEVHRIKLDQVENISALALDAKGLLWIGGFAGLSTYDTRQGDFKEATQINDQLDKSKTILTLLVDRAQNVWAGTTFGLAKINMDGEFSMLFSDDADTASLSSNHLLQLFEDRDGILWVGTQSGLNALDPRQGAFKRYSRNSAEVPGLSNETIVSINQSKDGTIWLGTQGGLNALREDRKHFEVYSERDGLASNVILGISEDSTGRLWLSTDRGLVRLNPRTRDVQNYDVYDGLQGNEFNAGSFGGGRGDMMFFGGVNGLTAFHPRDIQADPSLPKVVLTGFKLFNETIHPKDQDDGSPLTRVIGQTKELHLSYRDHMIGFDLAVLHYGNPRRNQFAYMLENLNNNWIYTDATNPSATYTNLGAGKYILRVKGAHLDGIWNEAPPITIHMEPPPWLSTPAMILYGLVICGSIFGYIRVQHKKLAAERKVNEQQNKINEQLRQLDRFKDEILANTSHELRTPLNGIIGLADSLRDDNPTLNDDAKRDLATIVSCGRRLSSLINDILDYSRLKNRKLSLNKTPVDLKTLTNVVLSLSKPLIGSKELKLIGAIPENLPPIEADEDRLQQIFHNLVGNAIKFTERGYVKVEAKLRDEGIEIIIADTGIGIPTDKLENIFNAFEQGETSAIRNFGGTGLGLAITKRLVALHGGDINVHSIVGQGTTFSFTLPITGIVDPDTQPHPVMEEEVFVHEEERFEEDISTDSLSGMALDGNGNILVVDDESVNRQVLSNYLKPQGYSVTEAATGQEALDLLGVADVPPFDLVLLDIMMPRMSGYEVCRLMRDHYRPSELPIIFLSAKNQARDLLEGFFVGANDYLAKPISKGELLARVSTHLELLDVNRNLERKVTERTQELEAKNKKIMEQQEELIRKQRQLVMQEKMASVGTLTAGIAHEINNPVNFAHGSVQNLVADLGKFREFFFDLAGPEADEEILTAFRDKMKPLFEHSETIMEGTKRISGIVKELQTFSRMDEADIKKVSLIDGIKSTLSLVKANYATMVEFDCDFQDPLEIECWPAEMNQVFMNMVVNGCQAIVKKQKQQGGTRGERLLITTKLVGDLAHISFRDDGCGMSEEIRDRIFEPFFTTKPVGEGTGLGLSISYEIINKHHGTIEVESSSKGTTMTVILPKTIEGVEVD